MHGHCFLSGGAFSGYGVLWVAASSDRLKNVKLDEPSRHSLTHRRPQLSLHLYFRVFRGYLTIRVPPAAGLAFGALREPGGSTGSFPRRRMTLICRYLC